MTKVKQKKKVENDIYAMVIGLMIPFGIIALTVWGSFSLIESQPERELSEYRKALKICGYGNVNQMEMMSGAKKFNCKSYSGLGHVKI